MQTPETIYLKDYRLHPYRIETTELTFEIYADYADVTNRMTLVRQGDADALVLVGEQLELLSVTMDDHPVETYTIDDTSLTLPGFDSAIVEIVTRIYPDQNTQLEGLYRSGDIYCTQNEPHGFRRITFFIDRPDNMSVYTTKVIADKAPCPILLANGNLRESGTLDGGRHFALWHDPHPKPSYLFALVAGDLGSIHDTFVTAEGRHVDLNIYVDHGNESRAEYAMRSLKAAMQWDEEEYGRCYDLDVYNIVAVASFNMGAMENKGLNIFNAHYVLAGEETATDGDYLGIESVIAHEYFHNWTGNRITCRDWFSLTLKEGLTVFRDQCFSADMNSAPVQRILDVKTLRERQFPEDAGPTAHPIKPDHYIEINNFYTATVYEKGAEVIRMLHTILGPENWRKATDLYFDTFDGQAVTTEDFLWAMQQHSPIDLTQFALWYRQERTPTLEADSTYDAQTLTLSLRQVIPAAVDGSTQQPYCFPLRFDLPGVDGWHLDASDQPLKARGILLVRRAEETFRFVNVSEEPTLSLNGGFTAPVILRHPQRDPVALMHRETDGFNRYEAAHGFAVEVLEQMMAGEPASAHYLDAFGAILQDDTIDAMLKAQLLELPSIATMMQRQTSIDVAPILQARDALHEQLAARYEAPMHALYTALHDPKHSGIDAASMANRALKNRLLDYLAATHLSLAEAQYRDSVTMTDRISALGLLEQTDGDASRQPLEDFYARYRDDALVMTKYFAVRASSRRDGTLERVQALLKDPVFDLRIPNLVRALIGAFARNPHHFHAEDGSGYDFVAQQIITLDPINAQIAAGLAGTFKSYTRMNPKNKAVMKTALESVLACETISKNVYEVVERTLKG